MGKQQKLKEQRRVERETELVTAEKRSKTWLISTALIAIVAAASVWLVIYNQKSKKGDTVNTQSNTTTSTDAKDPIVTIETAKGNIVLELFPKVAPKTVANFVKLAKEGFYDGVTFHRVVQDFVIQGGDPLSKNKSADNVGTGGPGYKFDDEISAKALGLSDTLIQQLQTKGYKFDDSLPSMHIKVGTVAMANSGPNTNGSQFFIVTTKDQPQLDGQYTAFGQVKEGMDVVLKITQGDEMKKVTVQE